MAFLHRHTFNLFPHYPQLPFALFILHLFILNQFILHLISSTLSTIIHILPWLSFGHIALPVSVTGLLVLVLVLVRRGLLMLGRRRFLGLIAVFSDSDSSIQGTLSALETNLDQVFAIKLSDLKSLAKSGP